MIRASVMVVWITVLELGAVFVRQASGADLAAMRDWDIVVAPDALPSEVYAGEEFQTFFEQASGVKLPIVAAADRPYRHVFVGPGEAMRANPAGFDVKEFGPEDLRIVVRDGSIVIAGGRPRGTLYGVYTFLEDYLGVRFLTADHTYVPRISGERSLPVVDRFYHPPLEYRFSYYGESIGNKSFGARLRHNANDAPDRFGGSTRLGLINHSFASLIPADKYGKEHPEYFAEIDGERTVNRQDSWGVRGGQPCLTNPDVLRIVIQQILATLAARPEMNTVSVSQNDNTFYCRCANCRKLDEAEGSGMGTMLPFVNAVAEAVGKEHPRVLVGTLAYKYTRRPPKSIRPRPNVMIQLSSIEACQIHAIDDPACSKNTEFCGDLDGWAKICTNVCIWTYQTNFKEYLLPYPNYWALGPNIRHFLVCHARGIFVQGAGNAIGAEMSELRNYVASNLLWDPTRDGKKLIEEFVALHYGKAAPPIQRYLDFAHARVLASGKHPDRRGTAAEMGLDDSVVREGMADFAEALKLADDGQVRSRAEKASICVYRLAIEPVWEMKSALPLTPEVAQEMRPLARRFFELCRTYGVTMAGERTKLKEAEGHVRDLLGIKPDDPL